MMARMPPAAATTHLLYLHGFRSSPQSTKARAMAERVAREHPAVTWWCPQLPASPGAAMQMLEQGTADWPRRGMAVIGSSLGGFYAALLAEQTGCKAALLNPAVFPARDLAPYVGVQTSWHDAQQQFVFEQSYVDALQRMQHGHFSAPQRYFTLIAKGDAVLDWREMRARYPAQHGLLLEGSDHALSDFDVHAGALLEFLALA